MDDLELLQLLGDGGQGRVYRARKKANGTEFAVKVMPCKEQSQLDYALKEVKVLPHMRHENIVSYMDFFLRLDGWPEAPPTAASAVPAPPSQQQVSVILLMEYCNEGTLADRIEEAKASYVSSGEHCIGEDRVLRWLRQCAGALMYMHDRGFLHRDLKPSNVFLHRDAVKIGDFGLATPARQGVTSHVGTPYYSAPELLLRQAYDDKVDVWGLGITFLELTTLTERPVNSEVLESPSRVDAVIADITYLGFSNTLATLIRDMLQRNPASRPTPRTIMARLHVDSPAVERLTVTPPGLGPGYPDPELGSAPPAPQRQPLGAAPRSPNQRTAPKGGATARGAVVPPPLHNAVLAVDVPLRTVDVQPSNPATPTAPPQLATAMPPLSRAPSPLMCDMCDVFPAVICCAACDNERYCEGCDDVKHRNSRRSGHQRCKMADGLAPAVALAPKPPVGAANVPRATQAAQGSATTRSASQERNNNGRLPPAPIPLARQAGPVAAASSAAPRPWPPTREGSVDSFDSAPSASSAGDAARAGSAPRGASHSNATTLYVPSQSCASIQDALAVAVPGTTIVVAAGGAYADALVFRVPGVTLVGEGEGDARPRIGDGHMISVHITAPDCRVSNFVVTQALPAAEPVDRPFAILVGCSGAAIVDRCEVRSLGYGVGVTGDQADATVRNCVIRGAKQAGVYAFNGSKCAVLGCTITRSEYAGVLVKKRARALISGCTIRDGLQSGVFFYEASGVLERSTIANSGGCGVVLKARADPSIRGNVIQGSGQAGVFCCDRSTGTIAENQILSSAKAGLIVKTEAHPTVSRNLITQGKETGVYVFEHGAGHFEENEIKGNANVGIVVTTGGDPRVLRNVITLNQHEGVWVCNGGRGLYEGNDVRGNLRGAKDLATAEAASTTWLSNRES